MAQAPRAPNGPGLLTLGLSVAFLSPSGSLIFPLYKKCRDKDRGDSERMANQELAQLETHPMGKYQYITLLMILSYACRQEPSITERLCPAGD